MNAIVSDKILTSVDDKWFRIYPMDSFRFVNDYKVETFVGSEHLNILHVPTYLLESYKVADWN